MWSGPEDLPLLTAVARTYPPQPDEVARMADLRVLWAEAVKRSMKWERE